MCTIKNEKQPLAYRGVQIVNNFPWIGGIIVMHNWLFSRRKTLPVAILAIYGIPHIRKTKIFVRNYWD
jgi:hypothetical protein